MSFYDLWQENHYFELENNVLKKKQFIYTPFIKTNQNGFLNGDFRSYLFSDSLARYYKFRDFNVLNNIGFDTLAYSSMLESNLRKSSNEYNLNKPYLDELINLNVGYIKNRLINTNDPDVITIIQKVFLYLYNKGIIKYGNIKVLKENNKYYDDIEVDRELRESNEDVFYLDITKYQDKIVKNIDNLSITKELKEYFYKKLKRYVSTNLTLITNNEKEIELELKAPEELGALQAILINPTYVDILEYVDPSEIFSIENFLIYKDKKYLYSANYCLNPLTGKQIPIFFSFSRDEAFSFLYSTRDKEALEEIGLDIINIYQDNTLINSDFLNGLTKSEAREKLVDTFIEEGMARKVYHYAKDKILITSLDNYGAIFPMALKANNIVSLEKNIPIYFDNHKININLYDSKLFDNTINSLFTKGLEIIISILYEKFVEIDDIVSKDNLNKIKLWLNNAIIVCSKKDIVGTLLMPVILLTIIEQEEKISLLKKMDILVKEEVYDAYGNDIKRNNNNCIKVDELISGYDADSIRLYYLSHPLEDKIFFAENKIYPYKEVLNDIRTCLYRGFVASNYDLEFPMYQLKNKLYDVLCGYDLASYIKHICEFVKKYFKEATLTKKQALEFLTILSVVAPNISEELNNTELKNKSLIIEANWPL